jgi:hypothetical protein
MNTPVDRRRRIATRAAGAAALVAAMACLVELSRARTDLTSRARPANSGPIPIPSDSAFGAPVQISALAVQAPRGGSASPNVPPVSEPDAPLTSPRSGTKHTPTVNSSQPTTSACDPPFVIDSDGIRHYKRACIR